MADILTRLLLKTDNFDRNLSKSKRNVNSFQGSMLNASKVAGAGVLKFAGGLGVAVTAGEAFMKTVRGSQKTSDAFDNTMAAAKVSVEAFFSSLSRGDFSAFENGLFGLAQRARELNAELDDLADKRLSVDFTNLGKETELLKLEAIMRDKSKSKEERNTAMDEYKRITQEIAESRLNLAQEEFKTNTNVELNKIGVNNLTQDDIIYYMEKLNNPDLNADFFNQLKGVTNYSKLRDDAWGTGRSASTSTPAGYLSRNGADSKFRQMEAEFNSKWPTVEEWMKQNYPNSEFRGKEQLMDFGRLAEQNDKGRAVLFDFGSKMRMAEKNNVQDQIRITNLNNRINGSGVGSGGGSAPDKTTLSGTLAWFDAEIKKQNDILINSTTEQARNAARATILELESQKNSVEFLDKHGTVSDDLLSKQEEYADLVAWFDGVIAKKNDDLSKATSNEVRQKIEDQIKVMEARKVNLQIAVEMVDFKASGGMEGLGGVKSSLLQDSLKGSALPDKLEPIPTIKPKDVQVSDDYAESLQHISSIMYNMNNLTNEGAAAWLAWGGSLMASLASAIPAVKALTAAKKEEAIVNGVASATQTPLVGWLMAGAAVTSVLAALSSIPAFESGGVVPGMSFSGDKVLARLNSSEMILNNAQQSNLFKMLNSGDNGGQQGGGVVEFRINGTTLVGVLNNYNKRMSKLR